MKKTTILLFIGMFLTACNSSQDGETVDDKNEKVTETNTQTVKSEQTAEAGDGQSAPLVFRLTNLDGEQVKASDFRGQWLVLNYWATWCAPCREEIPELVRFQQEHNNVQILGIAYEDATTEKLKNFAADFNVNYPLLTMDIYNPPAFAAEGGLGLPTTIVYNPEGMRHKKHLGPIDYQGLKELIQ